jgi:opacity protein-like surface antigen
LRGIGYPGYRKSTGNRRESHEIYVESISEPLIVRLRCNFHATWTGEFGAGKKAHLASYGDYDEKATSNAEDAMNRVSKLALCCMTAVMLAGTADAADLTMAPPTPEAIDTSSAWDGPYLGGYGIWYNQDGYTAVGALVGVNFLPSESFLIGVEGSLAYFFPTVGVGTTGLEGTIGARAGFVTGPALVYVSAGERYVFALGGALNPYVGVGAELSVTDNLSVRGEGRYYWTSSGTAVMAGFVWRPN